MTPLLSQFDYSVFPPINAALNGLSTLLLATGFVLIKSGHRLAHQRVMVGALVSSALFLACYLVYHYGAGHTEFPKAYPVARKVYFAILIPHVILAVVNLPFIILLVVAAARGRFERHKRIARYLFPSWFFVSLTGVVIYFMIYQWFPAPRRDAAATRARVPGPAGGLVAPSPGAAAEGASTSGPLEKIHGGLVFSPLSQVLRVDPGQDSLEVFFQVKNPGEVPVRIAKLESGCECLEVSVDRNPVPAGAGATIKGIFDVSKLRGTTDRKIVVVPEGAAGSVTLKTRIVIEPVYEFSETMTTWPKDSDATTRTVEFRILRKEPVHVLSAKSKRPEVACKVVEVEKGRLYHLELTPDSTEKTLLGIVRLETDCELEAYARPLLYYSIQ